MKTSVFPREEISNRNEFPKFQSNPMGTTKTTLRKVTKIENNGTKTTYEQNNP